jgi:hypothetical protein
MDVVQSSLELNLPFSNDKAREAYSADGEKPASTALQPCKYAASGFSVKRTLVNQKLTSILLHVSRDPCAFADGNEFQ